MDLFEWSLHVTTDRQGHPEFAWLSVEMLDSTSGQRWLDDVEFGPFDTRWDVGRWLVHKLATENPLPPARMRTAPC